MPSCRITNYTSQPLNVSLKHLCALHFENSVQPGQTVKLKPANVWFTLEVLVDDKDNQYSMAQSAAVIAIVSIAAVATVATAGASVAAAGGASAVATGSSHIAGALVATGTTAAAFGETALAGFASAVSAGSSFLAAHAGTAAKISAVFLPKAIEAVEKEVGGFTNVQKEVVSILSSPNVTEDVRKKGLSILGGLVNAFAEDRAAERAAEAGTSAAAAAGGSAAIQIVPQAGLTSKQRSASNSSSIKSKPSIKRAQSSVSTFLSKVTSSSTSSEVRSSKREAKLVKKEAQWEVVDFDAKSEPAMLTSKERLRIHGLRMNERKHFEVREKNGKLVLVDAITKEVVAG